MGFLTIGAFARASRLSPRALRLYDELGLLRPASVDPVSGYRYYLPDQLDRARLVAWLRRLGMPLARIAVVCDLAGSSPTAAAAEVAAYWRRVESDIEARAGLAAFLVDTLSRAGSASAFGEDAAMSDEHPTFTIRYAVRSDRGLVRESNQDSAYAGARLLAVADGFGPQPGAELASAVAIEALRPLDAPRDVPDGPDAPDAPAGVHRHSVLDVLHDAVVDADAAVREFVASDPARHGGGTTLTALLWSGSRLALVHVGDSRVYLLRDGELFRLTHDHTVVQSLIDDGRLTEEEALSHPQRSILVRALHGERTGPPEADTELRDAVAGDRYLLCSDGLHTVVPAEALATVLGTAPDPDTAVRRLVELANEGGGPDNVTCVVADVVGPVDR